MTMISRYTNGPPTSRSPAPSGSNPDPVGEHRFTVKLPITTAGGITLGSFKEISGIGVEVETMDYMEGGNNEFVYKLPTRLKYQNITLKRGITHHATLLEWFSETRRRGVQAKKAAELTITLVGPRGELVRTWAFVDAYPVKWTGPTLNAGSNQIATESLEIAHSGLMVV
jgi:phage tail-like protein